jgi:hypothetical protein
VTIDFFAPCLLIVSLSTQFSGAVLIIQSETRLDSTLSSAKLLCFRLERKKHQTACNSRVLFNRKPANLIRFRARLINQLKAHKQPVIRCNNNLSSQAIKSFGVSAFLSFHFHSRRNANEKRRPESPSMRPTLDDSLAENFRARSSTGQTGLELSQKLVSPYATAGSA